MNDQITSVSNQDSTMIESKPSFENYPTIRDFQNKFDVLMNTIPDGLILLKDEKIKYSNKKFSDMLGYTITEITELDISAMIAPNNLEIVLDRGKKRMRGETVPNQYNIDLIHKDKKSIVPVSVSVGVIGSGTERFQFVIIKDLSDKIEIETKFVRELQLQQYFMDYLPDSIYF